MKKLLMTLALAICCALAMTSCNQLGTDEWVYYSVNPNGEFSGTNAMAVAQLMRAALQTELTNDIGLAKRNDSKAIQLCDRVYNDTKLISTGRFQILLDVKDFNGNTSNLKTYNYN